MFQNEVKRHFALSGFAFCIPVIVFVIFTFTAVCQGRLLHVSRQHLDGITPALQFDSIGRAVSALTPGDTLLIHGGVYRERVTIEADATAQKPILIRAAEGENVVLTGADELKDWQKHSIPGVYVTDWDAKFLAWTTHQSHPSDEYHLLTGRCEQVFVNGYLLRQVLNKNLLSRGTFFVDTAEKRLYACDYSDSDLSSKRILTEASRRGTILKCDGNFVTIKGIRFRYAANAAQHGAVEITGDDCKVEDCLFEYTNSCGAEFHGQRIQVIRCTFQHNGQLGFAAGRAHNLHMTGCLVQNNNTKGFDRNWEAGGNKIALTRGMIVEKSVFRENRGHGIWFDIGNEDCCVKNCLIADNENAGIFYEISYRLFAHDNVIVGNGFAFSPGNWGANAGINLSSSPGCVIERNLLISNKEGFAFREQKRSTPMVDGGSEAVWNHDNTIRNNILAYNRDAQVWGWFDVDDQRHWPKALQQKKAESSNGNKNFSLEDLNLTIQGNLYAAAPGQGLFNWGVTWKRHKKYSDLKQVEQELSLTQGGSVADLFFEDLSAYDFRLDSKSEVNWTKCYPKGAIPGVKISQIGR